MWVKPALDVFTFQIQDALSEMTLTVAEYVMRFAWQLLKLGQTESEDIPQSLGAWKLCALLWVI